MEKWKTLFGKVGKDRIWICILGGLLLLVITYPLPDEDKQQNYTIMEENCANELEKMQKSGEVSYVTDTEKRIETILSHMQGVGETEVLLTYEDNGDEKRPPAVRGMLVVAQGGANPQVVAQIQNGIMALFGIEQHKIVVVKMKGE